MEIDAISEMLSLYKGKSESKCPCFIPMKHDFSKLFICPALYMAPLLGGEYLEQCRKCSISWKLATTEQVDKGSGVRCCPTPAGTKHRTHEQLQTNCGCMWCRCEVRPAIAEVVLVTANGQVSWTRTEVVFVSITSISDINEMV
jgi:hypothetical protein